MTLYRVERVALTVALWACSSSSPAPPATTAPAGSASQGITIDAAVAGAPSRVDAPLPPPPQALAAHDEVCRDADDGIRKGAEVRTCGAGLTCCYPCGISGCAWVCHTASECARDRERL